VGFVKVFDILFDAFKRIKVIIKKNGKTEWLDLEKT
jgi:hypothetical protein